MKITKRHLRKIIKEEVGRVLKEDRDGFGDFLKDEFKAALRVIDRFVAGPSSRERLGALEDLVADKKRELELELEDEDVTVIPGRNGAPDAMEEPPEADDTKERDEQGRAWAAEIRKKMKQYPPKGPMRAEIANLLDRYPEEEEENLEV